MTDKQFTLLLSDLKSSIKIEHLSRLFFLLKAWKKLSNEIKKEELTFEYFFKYEVNSKKLLDAIKSLSNSNKLFELFLNQNIRLDRIKNDDLNELINIVNKDLDMPMVFDIFYTQNDYMDFSVANQIADFSVKLLGDNCNEIYAPFSNGYNIGYYTDKKILAESFADEYIVELMKIIDDIDIDFTFSNPLENPTYIDSFEQLKQFECVLSFPPMGLSTNNEFLRIDKYNRFKFHKVRSNREVAHFEHILSQCSAQAVVLMPVGFTYRGNQDEEFRKYLVKENILEAVIQLPPNLHNATSIETTFVIINKKKTNNDVYFLNLKHESFLHRIGRKLVLNDIDNIVSIYKEKKELDNISRWVTPNEILNNNYSVAIDRYIHSKEFENVQKQLNNFHLVKLEDISNIRRSQQFKDEDYGEEIYEITPSDFSKFGFTKECGKLKRIGSQDKKLQTYKLETYDVLLSTKGTIGKVAIVGESNKTMIASQAVLVIRLKESDKKDKAIALYMFLKSILGQTILSTLQTGVAMPQIATSEIKKLQIPLFTKDNEKELFLNFNNEIEMYNKITLLETNIQQIHNKFLGNN